MEVRHILHSLALAKFIQSDQPLTIADIGSGGGFPGIPLCIVFPQHNFVLVESIKKKCMVISNVVESLNLQNVQVLNQRAEECTMKSDLIVSRAVARAVKLINWTRKMRKRQTDYVCLKGGDLNGERDELWTTYPKATWTEYLISEYFNDPFFETKKIIKISGV
jgi:16S rRNA (guanine527-N7)-methyltransferase